MGPYTTWMTSLPKSITSKPLNTVAIPGSHVSFTAALNPYEGTLEESSTLPGVFKKLNNSVDILKYVVTQTTDLRKQLKAGIRYFDFKVCANPKNKNKPYFCHGYLAQSVEAGLREIANFLDEFDKEIVLLDFRDFYGMTEEVHTSLVALLTDIFGERICERQETINLSLEAMWKENEQVVIFYQEVETVKQNPNLWSGYAITSLSYPTDDVTKLLKHLDDKKNGGHDENLFYVTKGIVTPSDKQISANLGLRDLTDTAIKPFINWMKSTQNLNIILIDFAVEYEHFIPTVINLNYYN